MYISIILYIYPLLYPVYIHCISLAMFIHHETSWNLGVLELWISRWSLEGRWLRHRLSSGFFPCAFRTRAASSAPHAEGEPMWDSRKSTMNLWEFGNLWEIYGTPIYSLYLWEIYGKSSTKKSRSSRESLRKLLGNAMDFCSAMGSLGKIPYCIPLICPRQCYDFPYIPLKLLHVPIKWQNIPTKILNHYIHTYK